MLRISFLVLLCTYCFSLRKKIPAVKVSQLYRPTLNPESFDWSGVISHYEASELLKAQSVRAPGKEKVLAENLSIDLGKTRQGIFVDDTGISLENEATTHLATWAELGRFPLLGTHASFLLHFA